MKLIKTKAANNKGILLMILIQLFVAKLLIYKNDKYTNYNRINLNLQLMIQIIIHF